MTNRNLLISIVSLLALTVAILVPLPWQVHAVAAFLLTVPLTGYLLTTALGLAGRVTRAEHALFAMGSGYSITVVLLLFLSYLPGGIQRWHILIVFNAVALTLAAMAVLRRPTDVDTRDAEPEPFDVHASSLWPWLGIVSIVLVAGVLRLPGLGYSEFQDDEVSVVWHAAEVIQGRADALYVHDKGPAEILIAATGYALADRMSEASARLPFAIANVTALLAIFWLGWRFFGPASGWAAALLLAVDGYFIGFSRIVQYQSVVFLMAVLVVGILYIYVRRPQAPPALAYLAALFFATGVLAHFEAAIVVVPGAYLLYAALKERDSTLRSMRHVLLPILLSLSILLLFYVPFSLHPRFARTFTEITGNRIGGGFPYNNLSDFFTRTIIYSSTYYFAFVVATIVAALLVIYRRVLPRWLFWSGGAALVAALAAFFRQPDWLLINGTDYAWLLFALAMLPPIVARRVSVAERATWLWFAAGLILALFFVQKPRTHVYDFFIPMALIAGSVVGLAWLALERQFGRRVTLGVAVPVAAALILVFGNYGYWMFAHNRVEVLRTWEENRPAGYWTPMKEARQNAIFGFPFKNGWKVVGALYADGTLDGPFARNGKRGVSNWYTRFATECSRDARYFVYTPWNEPTNKGLTDAPQRPTAEEGYSLIHVVTVNGEPRLEIFERDASVDTQPVVHEIADYDTWFDAHLSAPRFEAPGPAGWVNIEHPFNFRFGDGIWLRGYTLQNQQPQPGERVDVTLYWQADSQPAESYKVFTQVIDLATYDKAGQRDGVPACERHPTDRWLPGDLIVDRYSIEIADDAPPGDYSLLIGMYDDAGERLEVYSHEGEPLGEALGIDTITVAITTAESE